MPYRYAGKEHEEEILFDEQTQLLVKNKGSFQPPEKSKQNAWYCCWLFKQKKFDNAATKNKSNISKNEWQGLKLLKENDFIVIKEADKGEAVVVINKTHYYSIVLKIPQDEETYKTTNENCEKKRFQIH